MTRHPSADICRLCSDPDYFDAVQRGIYTDVVAHERWSEEFCPYADDGEFIGEDGDESARSATSAASTKDPRRPAGPPLGGVA